LCAAENNPPRVSGSKRLHATVGQEVSFTLRIEDDDVMDTWEVFTTNTHNVTAATFDAGLAKFTWTPQDLTPVVIRSVHCSAFSSFGMLGLVSLPTIQSADITVIIE
jgi:hypothetical protein